MIKALQMVDKYKVETPASRPDNELIKDKSIIPPPVTIDDIPESMKIIQGLCVVANV
ncbi:TVG0432809 [Thermoplasma volcanium GSS1]|uniref:TVG0432809 protein n=2 Tax=Thermoplasma volcanium TaxID=50339 RepID=Q97BL2_THEVO|nr:TVG0432809 [Thermoplasma volcanium GSS1]